MMMLAKMNHAHQEQLREGESYVFGYEFADEPPTPPVLLNTRDVPLLSNADLANTTGFLDTFMNGDLSFDPDAFNTFPTQTLPNFQGMTSTYGRPDTTAYDSSIFAVPDAGSVRAFDTTTFMSNRGSELSRPPIAPTSELYQRLFPNGLEAMPPEPTRRTSARSSQTDPTTLGFGSDAAFANRHYAPPPGQDEAVVTNKLMAVVQNFSYSPSAPTSQQTSPTTKRKRGSKDLENDKASQFSQARKRRRSEVEDTRSGGSSGDETDPPGEHSKGDKTDGLGWKEYRRRSKGKLNEPKRQNLTEKEKRQNHIRSEQKRRNQIKEGFSSLLSMMPEAHAEGSGNSKCIILAKSVEWLTGLNDGNARLRSQLMQLGGTM